MRELKTKSQWVMWKYETIKEKKQKVLYSAMTKHPCGANGRYSKFANAMQVDYLRRSKSG